MINVLIVDDEKIEREGLKYLISTETKEHKIFEASMAGRRCRFCVKKIYSFFLQTSKCRT